MTRTELDERRLLNGRDYANLPAGGEQEPMKTMQSNTHPDSSIEHLWTAKNQSATNELTPNVVQPLPREKEAGYLETMREKEYRDTQQVEASNRWQVLESQKSHHDITSLHYKMDKVGVKEQPATFYDHEGKFQAERSSLYKTTYDPSKLQYTMNSKANPISSKFDTSLSHQGALDLPVTLNLDMAETMQDGRTLGGVGGHSHPQSSDQATPYETIRPYDLTKEVQKRWIQPTLEETGVRVPENGLVLRESTMGESYNKHKFLQDYNLDKHALNEPRNLMSHENQNLERVRSAATPKSAKSVQFSQNILVASGAGGEPIRLSTAPIDSPRREMPFQEDPRSRPAPEQSSPLRKYENVMDEIARESKTRDPLYSDIPCVRTENRTFSNDGAPRYERAMVVMNPSSSAERGTSKSPIHGGSQQTSGNQFASHSSNVMPSNLMHSNTYKSSYDSQFTTSGENTFDLSYKNDPRFDWRVGSGTPRPQTALLQIQNSFTKSDTHKKFHQEFPEKNPDLRDNIISGRSHTFDGLNAQVLRGAPLVN